MAIDVATLEQLARLRDELTPETAFEKLKREGRCRLCKRDGGPTGAANTGNAPYDGDDEPVLLLTKHHLVPQWWFARQRGYLGFSGARSRMDEAANIVPLCGGCHMLIERDTGARVRLRNALLDDEFAFIVELRGRDWLDHRYPERLL